MIEVIDQSCVGCGACIKACAYDAIRIVNQLAVIDADKCTLCGACVQACPFDAIVIRKKGRVQADIQDHQGIWIFAEQKDGVIAPVVFESLGKGRDLADQMEAELSAVLLGSEIEGLASELIAFGADQVILVDDPDCGICETAAMPERSPNWPGNTNPRSYLQAPPSPEGLSSPEWLCNCIPA